MMKVKKIVPVGQGNIPIENTLNAFFTQEGISKDDVVKIHMDSDHTQGFIAFYVFYDDGQA